MKTGVLVVILTLAALPGFAEENSLFKEGSDLYRYKKYEEARVKFEQALALEPKDARIYFYLGVTYRMLNQPGKAIELLQKGLQSATSYKYLFLYELGNCYDISGLKDYSIATKYYTMSIAEKNTFALPYLNRANIEMLFKQFKEAKTDYITYLKLYPDSPQRPEIEKLLAILDTDMANQQKLLDSIMNSLRNASTDTQTDSAGTEGFKETEKEDEDILD